MTTVRLGWCRLLTVPLRSEKSSDWLFRGVRSLEWVKVGFHDDIRTNMDRDQATMLLLLDLSKAFDSVNHTLLLRKLSSNFGFSSSAVTLAETYLRGKNGYGAEFLNVTSGVAQGSILGLLLFTAFINDLPEVASHSLTHLLWTGSLLTSGRYLSDQEECV